jgi:hypothetical protein
VISECSLAIKKIKFGDFAEKYLIEHSKIFKRSYKTDIDQRRDEETVSSREAAFKRYNPGGPQYGNAAARDIRPRM